MAVKMIVFQNQFVPYTTLIIIIALRYFSRTYIDFIHLVEMELFFQFSNGAYTKYRSLEHPTLVGIF